MIIIANAIICSTKDGKAIWHTDTASPKGDNTVIAAVQNDGNVVLYKGTPIWSSNTHKG